MNRRIPIVFCAAIGLTALAACTTAPTAEPAKAPAITPGAAANMASNCFTCHGPDGRSPGSIPSLHNQTSATIAATLKAFKSGARPSTVMSRHAKGYSDAEIDALANYIGNLSKKN
jgi:sulfide dehydrogenase cytochrome subunit